jgi:hypothetical protein
MPTEDPTLGDVLDILCYRLRKQAVPAFRVGKRNHFTANAFVSDVASRIKNRPQISTDGLRAYVEAVENAFGSEVDYGMIIKNYGNDTGNHDQERRYSAREIVFSEKQHVMGRPNMDLVSTKPC